MIDWILLAAIGIVFIMACLNRMRIIKLDTQMYLLSGFHVETKVGEIRHVSKEELSMIKQVLRICSK